VTAEIRAKELNLPTALVKFYAVPLILYVILLIISCITDAVSKILLGNGADTRKIL